MKDRYFMATDNDGHWYVIPCDKKEEWNSWIDIDSDDERSWNCPEWAKEVGGSPTLVTFSDPEIK